MRLNPLKVKLHRGEQAVGSLFTQLPPGPSDEGALMAFSPPSGDFVRRRLADLLIRLVLLPWVVRRRVLKQEVACTEHFLSARIFRRLFGRYPVELVYPNPLRPALSMRLVLDLCENTQQIMYRARGRYEVEELRLLGALTEGVDTLVDVGAHVGLMTVTMAQAFPELAVVGVEPVPANHARLAEAVRRNGLDNVALIRGVVAPESGPRPFFLHPLNEGGGSTVPFDRYRTGDVVRDPAAYRKDHPDFAESITVDAVRLDDLVRGRTVVKIDAEGSEDGVLQSGEGALASGRIDALLVEVNRETARAVAERLDRHGFDLYLVRGRAPFHPQDPLPWHTCNLIAARRGRPSHGALRRALAR